MDLLLLACYTRFSCSLIKTNSQLAKNNIHPIYLNPSPFIELTKWPINTPHVSNLNWRLFPLCPNIHVYYTSIHNPLKTTGLHCKLFCTDRTLNTLLVFLSWQLQDNWLNSLIRQKTTSSFYFSFWNNQGDGGQFSSYYTGTQSF